MKFFKLTVLVLLGLNLCCMWTNTSCGEVSLCPPHPDLLEKLRKEGKLGELIKVLTEKPKYVDRPLPITTAVVGTKSAVVLLVDFPDKAFTYTPSHFSDILLSENIYPTGSMHDYYREVSYNKLNINGGISGWYRADNNYNYYIDSPNQNIKAEQLVREAINKANPSVDFTQYDNDNNGIVDLLIVVHAGKGGEEEGGNIWSHMCELKPAIVVDGRYITAYVMCPENGKIGVFSHEVGHLLGLPDLYDYGYDSEGIGKWSLMASGSWLGSPSGSSPAHPDAWCKIQMGWVTPNIVTTNINNAQIPQVETNPTVYKLWKDGSPDKEYFLVENRQKVGFDGQLLGDGLLIYHIDDNKSTNDEQWYPGLDPTNHYKVAVEQADGLWHLEKEKKYGGNSGDAGDPYYGDKVFNDLSTPDSKAYNGISTCISVGNISNSQSTMTANLLVNLNPPPSPFSLISPTNGTTSSTLTVNFKWGTTTAIGSTITYTLWYGTDSTFNTKVSVEGLTGNTYSATLVDNSTYYWKVKAVAGGAERWSTETDWRFYVNLFNEPPGTPTLKWPINGMTTSDLTPTFRWNGVFDPDPDDTVTYKLWYSKNANFIPKIEVGNIATTDYTPSSPLDNNSTYYWIVFAVDSHGSQTVCNGTATFITGEIIVYPNPLYPKDNYVTFSHLPYNSIVKIFTIAGELVTTITGKHVTCEATWQPKGIASGIYIYVIESDGEVIKKGKLGILR